jgi:ABC-2 type transport system ATP-binding protein
VLVGSGLSKHFAIDKQRHVQALKNVTVCIERGVLSAIVGPDGAGKTTLLRLATGLMQPDEGTLQVLGLDSRTHAQSIQERIGYMPQRFGLYEDLSVRENFDLYADMHGVGAEQRGERYLRLMEMMGLSAFADRLAGKLSGGMKQKLGLACTLVRTPELLLLDEPTVGVDPLSRRELWRILHELVRTEALSIVVSTSYMDEAEQCSNVLVLHEGQSLASGSPASIRSRAQGRTYLIEAPEPPRLLQRRLMQEAGLLDAVPEGNGVRVVCLQIDQPPSIQGAAVTPTAAKLEDGFMLLLRDQQPPRPASGAISVDVRKSARSREPVIDVAHLVRKFGEFTAVDRTSFRVHRGEVFGLLGPNGAGKTTTFRMLCGLLPATSGTLQVAGVNLRYARAEARQKIGYVAQKFALYGDLSVCENLEFFAGAYGLHRRLGGERIQWAVEQFDLKSVYGARAGQLPGGYQRRLAMAAALLHEPEILFLDEPTSGADPIARRDFWSRITDLSESGTTIVVTTHFMEEAEYCDRILIQDAGAMLALGTPGEVRAAAGAHVRTMDEAFVEIVERARRSQAA